MNNGDTFTIPEAPGHTFRVRIEQDTDSDAPWENSDGHGPVRTSTRADKRPGERILHKDRHTHWYYDWQAACKAARKDGWNTKPYDAPNRIERAVQADFDYLRGWCNDTWYYVGVVVELLDEDNGKVAGMQSLWGIESNSDKYIDEVAQELAGELAYQHGFTLTQRQLRWRDALREARERRHWAARDVETRA